MSFDLAKVRAQFPILQRQIHAKRMAYLDTAASAQKPRAVIDAMRGAMETSYANVHRGLHVLADESTQAYEAARASVARFLNAPSPDTIVFTKGATEGINLIAHGMPWRAGDEIIVSGMEHHANIVPWHMLAARAGIVMHWLEIDDDGTIDLTALEALITPRTRLLALTHMSNVLGVCPPAQAIVQIAHAKGVPVLLDGCQAVVHGGVDVSALGVDFYVFSAHKVYGPTGIGALYGRRERLAALAPFQGGGEMIETVTRDGVTFAEPPQRFEAGTPAILEAIGFGAAVEWLMDQDRAGAHAHEQALTAAAMEALGGLNWVRLYGRAPDKGPILAFNIEGAHPHDVAQVLDRQGVAVRAGTHCAQPLMQRLGVTATARASFGIYSGHDDLEQLLAALHRARSLLT
jgi:cysteine desulfurase / selenocysteine lyase